MRAEGVFGKTIEILTKVEQALKAPDKGDDKIYLHTKKIEVTDTPGERLTDFTVRATFEITKKVFQDPFSFTLDLTNLVVFVEASIDPDRYIDLLVYKITLIHDGCLGIENVDWGDEYKKYDIHNRINYLPTP